MTKPMTPANCMVSAERHIPHTWELRGKAYACDGSGLGEGPRRPVVGTAVHYVSHGTPLRPDGTQAYESACRAAIVTAVPLYMVQEPDDGVPNGTNGLWTAHLAVFNPTGMFFDQDLPYDPSGAGGTWHWPETI